MHGFNHRLPSYLHDPPLKYIYIVAITVRLSMIRYNWQMHLQYIYPKSTESHTFRAKNTKYSCQYIKGSLITAWVACYFNLTNISAYQWITKGKGNVSLSYLKKISPASYLKGTILLVFLDVCADQLSHSALVNLFRVNAGSPISERQSNKMMDNAFIFYKLCQRSQYMHLNCSEPECEL